MKITHINPSTMYKNPAFSQAVSVRGEHKTIYVGGQNGILPDGSMAGKDVGAQTEQALKNVLEVLKAGGASQENVVKLTIYLVTGQDLQAGFAASKKVWGNHATALTMAYVAGLANPEALVEVEAVAAVA